MAKRKSKSESNSPQHSHYIAIVAIVAVVAVVILVMNSMETSTIKETSDEGNQLSENELAVEEDEIEDQSLVGEAMYGVEGEDYRCYVKPQYNCEEINTNLAKPQVRRTHVKTGKSRKLDQEYCSSRKNKAYSRSCVENKDRMVYQVCIQRCSPGCADNKKSCEDKQISEGGFDIVGIDKTIKSTSKVQEGAICLCRIPDSSEWWKRGEYISCGETTSKYMGMGNIESGTAQPKFGNYICSGNNRLSSLGISYGPREGYTNK